MTYVALGDLKAGTAATSSGNARSMEQHLLRCLMTGGLRARAARVEIARDTQAKRRGHTRESPHTRPVILVRQFDFVK